MQKLSFLFGRFVFWTWFYQQFKKTASQQCLSLISLSSNSNSVYADDVADIFYQFRQLVIILLFQLSKQNCNPLPADEERQYGLGGEIELEISATDNSKLPIKEHFLRSVFLCECRCQNVTEEPFLRATFLYSFHFSLSFSFSSLHPPSSSFLSFFPDNQVFSFFLNER